MTRSARRRAAPRRAGPPRPAAHGTGQHVRRATSHCGARGAFGRGIPRQREFERAGRLARVRLRPPHARRRGVCRRTASGRRGDAGADTSGGQIRLGGLVRPAKQRQVRRLRLGADHAVEIEPRPRAGTGVRGRSASSPPRSPSDEVGQRPPIVIAGPHRQFGRGRLHVGQGELVPAVAAAIRFLEPDVGALRALHGSRPAGVARRRAGSDGTGLAAVTPSTCWISARSRSASACTGSIGANRVEQVQRGEHVARRVLGARAGQRDVGFTEHRQRLLGELPPPPGRCRARAGAHGCRRARTARARPTRRA